MSFSPTSGSAIKKLSKKLKPISERQDADAAVALLLRLIDQHLRVLLVKRVEYPGDPWSGKMAFPGGKRDPADTDLKQTVVRETLEETNINLLDRSCFLGVMNPLRSALKPEMKVLPFVVLLEQEPSIKLNEELESFAWVFPEELANCRGTARFSFEEFPAFILGKNVIWGLTYRILEELIQILSQSE